MGTGRQGFWPEVSGLGFRCCARHAVGHFGGAAPTAQPYGNTSPRSVPGTSRSVTSSTVSTTARESGPGGIYGPGRGCFTASIRVNAPPVRVSSWAPSSAIASWFITAFSEVLSRDQMAASCSLRRWK